MKPTIRWTRTFPTTSTESYPIIDIDPCGGSRLTYVSGGNLVTTKLSFSGNTIWTQNYPLTSSNIYPDISVNSCGDAYVAFYTNELGLIKYNSRGVLDPIDIGSLVGAFYPSITTAKNYFKMTYTDVHGNVTLYNPTAPIIIGSNGAGANSSIVIDTHGNIYIVYSGSFTNNIKITKLNKFGQVKYNAVLPPGEIYSYKSIVVDTSGNCYIAVHLYSGTYSVAVLKINSQGHVVWSKNIITSSTVLPEPSISISSSNLYVVYNQSCLSGIAINVTGITFNGNLLWSGPITISCANQNSYPTIVTNSLGISYVSFQYDNGGTHSVSVVKLA
jgi:hypothetical protein